MNTEKSAFYGKDGQALFRIAYDGRWYHDGTEIRRPELTKLFADRALKRDSDGQYWLQSPFEKYPVTVEDVPFLIVGYDIENNDRADQRIVLRTNLDDRVVLGADHGLELRPEPRGGVNVPYVEVRNGLMARFDRAVYYHLVAAAAERDGRLVIRSDGADHVLGVV